MWVEESKMKLRILLWLLLICGAARAQTWPALDTLRYGAAYYYEYMPQDRLEKDVALMRQAGINTVRIAESTWGVWEPRDGVFDFSKLDKVLDAMELGGYGLLSGRQPMRSRRGWRRSIRSCWW